MIEISKAQIASAIEHLDLSGRAVALHASLRSFRTAVSGGADTIIDAFLEQGCTLMMPTFSDGFAVYPPPELRVLRNGTTATRPPASYPGDKRIFTPSSAEVTVADMGVLAQRLLMRPSRQRGDHPLCSFTAIGPLAWTLVCGQRPLDVGAPWRVLERLDGRVLLMGVDLTSMTLLHHAERESGRRLFRRWANDAAGRPMQVECGGCSNGFEAFTPVLEAWHQQARVGASRWRCYAAAPSVVAARDALRATPAMTHCGRATCERCRDAVLGGPLRW